ncbi:MAG: peptidase MA family metallohydrolase [Thermomicrobiales bacterium]
MSESGRSGLAHPRWSVVLMIVTMCLSTIAPFSSAIAIEASTPTAATPVAITSPAASATIEDRTTVDIDFPTGLRFSGTLTMPGSSAATLVSFLYQAGYDDGWNLIDVPASDLTSDEDGIITIDTTFDFQTLQVPLGIHLAYRWVAQTGNGHAESAISETDWYDNRQPWQELTSDQVTLHFYGMDQSFAQSMLDSAQGTITDLEQRYDLARSERLSLWIYPEAEAFREGLPPNFRESVVGGSVVGYPLIIAVIPPGSTSEIGRIIPHEISHQVLFQATRNPFSLLPTWFDEGMATHIQIGGTGGYMGMVIAAQKQGALFDLSSLTGSFPYTPSQASLAYAASWSAIAFIEARWGEDGIAALIRAFGDGLPEDEAIPHALGLTETQFSTDWKAWIAAQG